MQITRVSRIKGHRIFKDFTWPAALPEFARFNLIYGWNGSGKTTLSNLFRAIEKKQSITDGEVGFLIGGTTYSDATFSNNPSLPNVRVFNRDYVEASVFRISDDMEPIFIVGADSVEKEKNIEELRKQVELEKADWATADKNRRSAIKAEDTFSSDKGVYIKDLVGGEATSAYRNYNKANFRAKAEILLKPDATIPQALSEDEKQQLLLRQQEKPKDKIDMVALSLESVSDLHAEAEKLPLTTVVARVIQHFVEHQEIARWVEAGLGFHKNENAACEFCGQAMPDGRLAEIEGHFNDADRALKSSLNTLANRIAADIGKLDRLTLPDKATIYADMSGEYENTCNAFKAAIDVRRQLLTEIVEEVKAKQARTFESVSISALPPQFKIDTVQGALNAVNELIKKHSADTDDFERRIKTARNTLESHAVADALPAYEEHLKSIAEAVADCERLTDSISKLEGEIAKLEREIVDHVTPADELNQDLRSYLGRDELVLKAEKKGYMITRHGFPARHLSEGERTAIAFLHFLKSLKAKPFTLETDIVVVDDPVSSLDSNSLFCAFAFLKERTKDAGQLFVLTHNFTFFSLVRKWFSFIKKEQGKEQRRHYMLETRTVAESRSASIVQLA